VEDHLQGTHDFPTQLRRTFLAIGLRLVMSDMM
jgi:hypothetical protein